MKRLLLFSFLIFLPFATYAQKKLQWDYPIKPGTEEWNKLESNKAKVGVCQIPEDVLRDTSTNDLMTLCLQYPLLYDVFAFNNANDGLRKLFADFNGIRELANREDAITGLQEQYLLNVRNFPEKINKGSSLDLGYAIMHISALEFLLSYSDFHHNTSKESQKNVLESLSLGYREKCKYSDYFKEPGFTSNLFARAHVIVKIDAAQSEKFEGNNKAVLSSGMANTDLIDTIDNLSFVDCYTVMYDIYTPAGSLIPTLLVCEMSIEAREYQDNYHRLHYPNAQQLITYDGLSTTQQFNCHGYAWLRVEQGIDRGIGIETSDEEAIFIDDNSYMEAGGETFPAKISWRNENGWPLDHSAVTTEQPDWVISKWGAGGPLCKHYWSDSPFGEGYLKYYIKNCGTLEGETVNFINRTTYDSPYIYSCGIINSQGVIVTKKTKLVLHAMQEVTINGSFEVEIGAELEIK